MPYELCLDLGSEMADPTAPAVSFLGLYKDVATGVGASDESPYLGLIPTVASGDCTTTDFFTDGELEMLQCPKVTARARKSLAARSWSPLPQGGGTRAALAHPDALGPDP